MAEVAQPNRASDKITSQTNKKIFGEKKGADLVIYRLIKQNDVKLREDTPLYPPYVRFPNKDIIVWEDGTREIRWLPGEQSIFVDEQEKNGKKIPDNILENPNNRFEIIDGEIKVRPHEKTKIQFLDMCNRNADSKHRTGTIAPLFIRYTEEKRIADLNNKQQKQEEAIKKAFAASEELVYFQAPYLNIALIDVKTSASREFEAIRTDYRQVAIDNPVEFLKIFDDEIIDEKFKAATK